MSTEHSFNHYRLLDGPDGHAYQDWLAAVKVTKKGPDVDQPFDASWMPGFVPETMDILQGNHGYVVPLDLLPGGEVNQDRNDQLRNARAYNREFPELLSVINVGLAVGVEKFDLSPTALTAVHLGWKHLGKLVPVSRYADYLYGTHDEDEMEATRGVIQRLHERDLKGTGASIEHIHVEGERYARIASKETIKSQQTGKRFRRQWDTPFYLERHFQDWIVTQADLATRTVNKDTTLKLENVLKKGASLTDVQREALDVLVKNAGYVVDKDTMATAAFNNRPLPENLKGWKDHIASDLKGKIKSSIDFSSFNRIGVGIGIKDLNIRPIPLKVLAVLWENYNAPVNLEKVAEQVYGDSSESSVQKAQFAVYNLVDDLKDTPMTAGMAYTYGPDKTRQVSPILVRRSSILAA